MDDAGVRVLGFAGSLRKDSFNRRLLDVAADLAPEGMTVEKFELDDIPLFNQDVEAQGDPEPVTAFKERLADADALLIVTPEYQQGIPGVLKNALDWGSRPPGKSPMQGKTAAIMGASPGMTATARAQSQLRTVLIYNDVQTVLRPEVLIGRAHEKIDEQGRLTDDKAVELVRELLEKLRDLTLRLRE